MRYYLTMLFNRSIIATSTVLAAHFAGMSGIYWIYKWFDAPVHFAGGFAAAVLALDIWRRFVKVISTEKVPTHFITALFVIGVVSLIGILWELHEYILDQIRSVDIVLQPSLKDTMSDFTMDLLGGVTAYAVFRGK